MTDVATIGTFDGFHLGHRAVADALLSYARSQGMRPVAITFASHPLAELRPEAVPPMLTNPAQRKALLLEAGIADVVTIDFRDIRHMTAAQFLRRLRDEGIGALYMGFNNHIGCDRLSASQAAALGIMPVMEAPCLEHPAGVSSSAIRKAIAAGDVADAARMLGRPYRMSGTVVHGKHLGTTIGFPTANIETTALLPASGVYAVEVIAAQISDAPLYGMANIGTRPTFSDGNRTSFEVNIFDFDGNLYGRELTIGFIGRLRNERRFASAADLRAALAADRAAALALISAKA